VLDRLKPIGCLTGSLEDLHTIANLLAEYGDDPRSTLDRDSPTSTFDLYSAIDYLPHDLRSYLQLQKDVIFTNVIEETLTMENSLSEKSVFVHRAAPPVDNVPVKAADSPSMLEVARHIVQDHPYTFPAPAIRAEGISLRISETPAAKAPSLSGLTRVEREQKLLKDRRALNLRRRYKNLSTLLKLRKPPKSIRHRINPLKRGEKNENIPTLARTRFEPAMELHEWVSTSYTSYTPVETFQTPAMEIQDSMRTPYMSYTLVETIPTPA